MKKSIKSILAKSLAVAMAFSLAGIAPIPSLDAAAKKPAVTKKVTVKVGKTKTVKVTSKKRVKKTTWSLTKKGKKIVSLSKKKKKSVMIKGKKAGKAILTAKIKVGKKTYKKTCKITVKANGVVKSTTPTKNPITTLAPTAAATNNSTDHTTPTPVVDAGAPTVAENGDVTLTLAADEIKASTNDGSGTITTNITKTDTAIEYRGAYTMQMLDISAYLEKYNLDLTNYTGIEITGKLLDENGDEVACGAGKIKTSLVAKANLNGYSDGLNTSKYKNFPTISIDISDIQVTDLAEAVGFNLRIDDDWIKGDGSAYTTMVIRSIKLIKAKE